jgi:hypothetical protein
VVLANVQPLKKREALPNGIPFASTTGAPTAWADNHAAIFDFSMASTLTERRYKLFHSLWKSGSW